MTIYILGVLVLFILFLLLRGKGLKFASKSSQGEKTWLYLSIVSIVLLWGMRGITVGLDTKSYSVLYDWAANASLTQYDSYWIEPGYAVLMMFCSQILHISYHYFILIISVFCGLCLLRFIKRYSLNYFLSIMTFVSFPLMAFYMSGIRNEIMISIMLLSIPLLEKKKAWRVIVYEVIILVSAVLIHKSGVICSLIPLFAYKNKSKNILLTYIFIPIILFVSKSAIYRYITSNFKDVGSAGAPDIGTSFIVNLLFFLLIIFLSQRLFKEDIYNGEFDINVLSIRLIYWSLIGALLTNGASDILNRMIIYFQMFFIIGIPNAYEISNQNKRTKNIVFYGIVVILFLYFYIFILVLDTYGIVPYVVYQ